MTVQLYGTLYFNEFALSSVRRSNIDNAAHFAGLVVLCERLHSQVVVHGNQGQAVAAKEGHLHGVL